MTETNITKQKFKSAIRRGTGEAYLIMQAYPKLDFSRSIIQACVKNFAVDGQCEDSRVQYIFGLIDLSVKQDKIREAILKALATENDDTWTLNQLFELAQIYAQRGYAEARDAIYARFLNSIISGFDWVGANEILELDGLDGMLYVAEKFGEALLKDTDDWVDDWRVKKFQEDNPDIDVWKELEIAGETNLFIKKYFDEISQARENSKSYKKETIAYDNVVDEVLANKASYLRIGRTLNETEVLTLAHALVNEKDKKRQGKLLKVFAKYKFPLDEGFLIGVASKTTASALNNKARALKAMAFLKSDRVRAFLLQGLNSTKYTYEFAWGLIANYQDGDETLLTKLIESEKNKSAIEYLGNICLNIYAANKTRTCKAPMEALYNNGYCGLCRKDVVKILIENNVLPDYIKNEIEFDCNEDTRALAM
jgi:hypothetical protein